MNNSRLKHAYDEPERGVYALGSDGRPQRVHLYQGGDYQLANIPELFELGELTGDKSGFPTIQLTGKDVRQLKVMADAYSFDFEEGLIELCLDICRFAQGNPAEHYQFWSDF